MGKAGKALKQALEAYGISQNKLAVTLGVDRSVVFNWFHEKRDPSAETVVQIASALNDFSCTVDSRTIEIGHLEHSVSYEYRDEKLQI